MQPLVVIPHTLSEITGPQFNENDVSPQVFDLTKQHKGEPLGERIVLSGRVLDEDARPIAHTLVEVWQANAAGRYLHDKDRHDAPIDPNFTGVGRAFTDQDGRYRFLTIKPGAYPWNNSLNGWRPAHIHFSLFGPAWATRLITQMYFPGDPLLALDPIFHSVSDEGARRRLVSTYDPELSQHERQVLHHVLPAEGVALTWLAGHLGLPKSTTSVLVKSLAGRGYVERSRDPGDERRLAIRLTDKGRQVVEADTVLRPDALAKAMAKLDARTRAALLEGLEKLATAAESS